MKRPMGSVLTVMLAVLTVAIAARISVAVPGSPVPQSLQTLAVVLVGAWLGPARGATALSAYVVAGGLGAPVFADGAGGAAHLVGPTAGYLVGFVLGAAVSGWSTRIAGLYGRPRPVRSAGFGMGGAILGHAVILATGWGWLAATAGAGAAYASGVAPFLVGAVAKSAVAAVALAALPPPPPGPVADGWRGADDDAGSA